MKAMAIDLERDAQKAIKDIEKELSGKYSYVVEADIKGFFNNIDHEWIIRMLEGRIKDKAFLRSNKEMAKSRDIRTEWRNSKSNKWMSAGVCSKSDIGKYLLTLCDRHMV